VWVGAPTWPVRPSSSLSPKWLLYPELAATEPGPTWTASAPGLRLLDVNVYQGNPSMADYASEIEATAPAIVTMGETNSTDAASWRSPVPWPASPTACRSSGTTRWRCWWPRSTLCRAITSSSGISPHRADHRQLAGQGPGPVGRLHHRPAAQLVCPVEERAGRGGHPAPEMWSLAPPRRR
jgi:hypothetical protein